ncbi:hypothetical protein BC830DRAFT_1118083 [Chytriomyces sp. MP71]|nr:hypothetical protein BC830DRAFT_1118083 [Chytriomyces sp. MP71]
MSASDPVSPASSSDTAVDNSGTSSAPTERTKSASGEPMPAPILVLDAIPANGAPFAQKRLDLSATPLVRIGRKVNVKSGPEPQNGIFDSKVLSRNHAEIWFENGKVWLKDVKSSNGTFINGLRLSEEGQASEPHEIKSGDAIEFGIDIMNDDGLTVMYYKVSAKATIWDPQQGPLPPAPSVLVTKASGEWIAVGKRNNSQMDVVFSMLDDEIRKAALANDQLAKLRSEVSEIDSLVVATSTAIANTFAGTGLQPASTAATSDAPTAAQNNVLKIHRGTISGAAINASTAALIELQSQHKQLAARAEALESRNLALETEAASLRAQLAESARSLKETRDLSGPVYRDNDELKKRRQEAEAELSLVRRDAAAERDAMMKQIEELKQVVRKAKETEEAVISTSLAATQAQAAHLETLEAELLRLQAEKENSCVRVDALEETGKMQVESLAQAEEERKSALAEVEKLQALLEDAREQLSVTTQEAESLKKEVEKVRRERDEGVAKLDAEKKELEHVKQILDQQMATSTKVADEAKGKVRDAEARVAQADKDATDKIAEIEASAAMQAANAQVKMDEAKERVASAEKRIMDMEKHVTDSDKRVSEAEGRVTQAEKRAVIAEARAVTSDTKTAAAEAKFAASTVENLGKPILAESVSPAKNVGVRNRKKGAVKDSAVAKVLVKEEPKAVVQEEVEMKQNPYRIFNQLVGYAAFGCVVSFLTYLSMVTNEDVAGRNHREP